MFRQLTSCWYFVFHVILHLEHRMSLRLKLKLVTHFSLVSVWCTSPIALRSASLGCCPPGNSPFLPFCTITLWTLWISSSSWRISSITCRTMFNGLTSKITKLVLKTMLLRIRFNNWNWNSKTICCWLLLSFIALAFAFPLPFGLALALGFRANAVNPGRLGRAPTSKTPVSDWSWPCWSRS